MVPFPNCEPDTDVAMSDSLPSDVELFFPENHHSRLHSTASSSSGSSGFSDGIDYTSRMYYRNSLITEPDIVVCIFLLALFPRVTSIDYQPADPAKAVGLLQPASSFTHHG